MVRHYYKKLLEDGTLMCIVGNKAPEEGWTEITVEEYFEINPPVVEEEVFEPGVVEEEE